ncbi:aminoacylase [Acrasis kona]|uniref:N-acyl-aliphatic-L-amino acid amidohydrolase n=1 Tax=Acrasis kona TaxID=1008807 RepID=A0AAW2Z3E0_9EUKA
MITLCAFANTADDIKVIKQQDREVIERFKSYLNINTVQPNIDYYPAVDFLKKEAKRIGLESDVVEIVKGRPHVIIKWKGRDPSKKTVMLNSHMDVVPADPAKWNSDPFEAFWDLTNNNIYARGSQDMKCVGMQYLEAITNLKAQNFVPERTVYVTFVPEEEVGGHGGGMNDLVKSPHFDKLNVGFGLDEGLASPDEKFEVYYGERVAMWGIIEATGAVGHGSAFIKNTATEKINRVIQQIFNFRSSQEQELALRPNKRTGDVVSINLTSMKAGHTKDCGETYQMNVVPRTAQVGFDIRVTPHVPIKQVDEQVNKWASEEGVSIRWVQRSEEHHVTDLNDEHVKVFLDSLKSANVTFNTGVFPAATDARFLRAKKIPIIGFSPMNLTPVLLHDHNEYLNVDVYLRGITIYENVIKSITK